MTSGNTGTTGGNTGTTGGNATTTSEKTSASTDYYQYLLEFLKQEASEEAVKIRNLMMRRIATEGTVTASRIPAPKNITELGGYINLLTSLGEDEMRRQTIAAALGVPYLSMPEI